MSGGFETHSDLEKAGQDNARLGELVKTEYACLDVSTTFQALTQCGQLLKIAYEKATGFPCSTTILGTFSHYQDLVHESGVGANQFVSTCLVALKVHKLALVAMSKNRQDLVVKQLDKLPEMATKMAEISDELLKKADALTTQATQAVEASSKDNVLSHEQKRTIEKELKEAQHQQAKLDQIVADANKDIQDADKMAKEMAARAAAENEKIRQERIEQARLQAEATKSKHTIGAQIGKGFRMIASEITGQEMEDDTVQPPPPTIDTSQLQALQAKEQAALERARMLADQRRQNNSQLAEALSKINKTETHKSEVEKSIECLVAVINMLGKIKTTFVQVKTFWQAVGAHCRKIADQDKQMLSDLPDWLELEQVVEGEASLRESAHSWAALGLVNLQAFKAVTAAQVVCDQGMSTLGVVDLETLSRDVQESLDKENSALALEEGHS